MKQQPIDEASMTSKIASTLEFARSEQANARVYKFAEFFAGGGMVRAGLGANWRCLFANDFDPKKASAYIENWGPAEIRVGDVRDVSAADLPDLPLDLAWASFPCQDLSLAGAGAGLQGDRSGSFWLFWERMKELCSAGRAPKMIVLENVAGTLTSHDGADFRSIVKAAVDLGYDIGALTIDAQLFVPQSRQRLFFVAVPRTAGRSGHSNSRNANNASNVWCSAALKRAFDGLPPRLRRGWIWWSMPTPESRDNRFADLIEDQPTSVKWHSSAETRRLLGMMSPKNLAKVARAKLAGHRMVGSMYRRMRREDGKSVQRVEVRFDDIAGCLRTPGGGSSRQTIIVVDGDSVRSRLISARETARLMGLADDYKLPSGYNDAYHLTGDGVVVPVVRYLAKHIFEPYLANSACDAGASAAAPDRWGKAKEATEKKVGAAPRTGKRAA